MDFPDISLNYFICQKMLVRICQIREEGSYVSRLFSCLQERLSNCLQESNMEKKASKIKVIVRVRPALKADLDTCVSVQDGAVEIMNHRNINENIKYDFAAVYDENSTQQMIYNDNMKPLLLYSLRGQNVSIFAYGHTGAGKTHTMLGSPSDPGVIPRVINGLFQTMEDERRRLVKENGKDQWKYAATFSYLEIYNEKVQDLLEPKSTDLPIREDGDKNIFVARLAEKPIANFDEFKEAFGPASNNRTVACTKLNDHSSRSHCIVLLKVTKTQTCPPHKVYHGKIYLIDLAGSEDNRRTGNSGIRLKESGAINKSLFALGEVVDAINNGLPRIPYRNSKLTRLLQDSVGGSCHSLMVTNIAPEESHYYDTYCTLNFASKSKKIVNSTCVRETTAMRKNSSAGQLKRPSTEMEDKADIKRVRLSPSVPTLSEPVPFLSPLLRKQTHMEETINLRLEELETNLMGQMRELIAAPGVGADMFGLMRQQLSVCKKQLQELQNRHTPGRQPLKNIANEARDAKRDKPAKARLFKREIKPEVSCSPLFTELPKRLKRKGAKSKIDKDSVGIQGNTLSAERDGEKTLLQLNPDAQIKHDMEILQLLNCATVQQLQSQLHTVGQKRAKLIFDYRQNFGAFEQIADLINIPGFTEKQLASFKRSNFVLSCAV